MIYKQLQVDQYIKKPTEQIKAFLLYGENIGLIEDNVKNLIKTVCADVFDAFNVARLDMDVIKGDFGILSSEYNAVSMMGERRVVVLKGAGNDLAKNIASLFETGSNTLLILVGANLYKSSALVKMFEKEDYLAAVACYDDRAEDNIKAVKNKIALAGLSIDNDALDLLISRLSVDRLASMAEIEKLIVYMGSKKNISIESVIKCVCDVSNSSFDDICYSAALGNHDKAQKSLHILIKEGEDASVVVSMLIYHFYKLMSVCALVEDGYMQEEAINKAVPKLLWMRKDAFKSQVRAWNKEKLMAINELLFETQKDLRTTNMPQEEIVSYLLMRIASAYRR